MEAAARSFGSEFFSRVDLKNRARNDRLVELADVLVAHPHGTFPKKLHDPAQLKAFYRLMNQPTVTHASVLAPAIERTHELMAAASGTVLVIHDWTELDYTGHTSMTEVLGQIGNGSRRGYVCANALAIVAETREVLGLAGQILFRRPDVVKGESRDARRDRATRESRLWRSASEQVPVPREGRRQVEVADRGADVLEYLDYAEAAEKQYLVRSKHNRRINAGGIEPETGADEDVVKLHELAESLPLHGRRTLVLPARPGHARREAPGGRLCEGDIAGARATAWPDASCAAGNLGGRDARRESARRRGAVGVDSVDERARHDDPGRLGTRAVV
jgi:hypothetical protein